jgi:hypothetical protein
VEAFHVNVDRVATDAKLAGDLLFAVAAEEVFERLANAGSEVGVQAKVWNRGRARGISGNVRVSNWRGELSFGDCGTLARTAGQGTDEIGEHSTPVSHALGGTPAHLPQHPRGGGNFAEAKLAALADETFHELPCTLGEIGGENGYYLFGVYAADFIACSHGRQVSGVVLTFTVACSGNW